LRQGTSLRSQRRLLFPDLFFPCWDPLHLRKARSPAGRRLRSQGSHYRVFPSEFQEGPSWVPSGTYFLQIAGICFAPTTLFTLFSSHLSRAFWVRLIFFFVPSLPEEVLPLFHLNFSKTSEAGPSFPNPRLRPWFPVGNPHREPGKSIFIPIIPRGAIPSLFVPPRWPQ